MNRLSGKDPQASGPKEEGVRGAAPPRTRPGGDKGMGSDVGNETRYSPEAWSGQPNDKGGALAGAVHELHSQHPIPYHDHGPHHGTQHHVRHEPLHGLKTEAHTHHAEKHSPSHREKHGR